MILPRYEGLKGRLEKFFVLNPYRLRYGVNVECKEVLRHFFEVSILNNGHVLKVYEKSFMDEKQKDRFVNGVNKMAEEILKELKTQNDD